MDNMTWDLDIFYKGYDDPKYNKDIEELKQLIESICAKEFDDKKPIETIEESLKLEERVNYLLNDLYSYSSYRSATNVNDKKAIGEITKLSIMLQDLVPSSVKFNTFLKDLDLDELAKESKYIKKYLFVLKNRQNEAKHMLSEKEEVLASKLKLVGSSSWSDLQSNLTANLKIKVEGIDEELGLASVRNLAYDADEEVRKKAYEAELKAYKLIDEPIAMALNNIKREVNIMMPLRGYKDAVDYTLQKSSMSEETLNALIEAIKEELPNFRRYFKLKAEALGHHNGLPFYDLFAPMGHMTKTYTFSEARDLVLEVYRSFSEPLYEMGKEAFDNRWIDVLPHEGKVGGAFCGGADNHNASRVLTNFTGALSDVQTLAHELGHAYHGRVCQENDILNRDYPMQLAETASIFCQTLMAKKMIADFDDPFEKLTIVENGLQEDSQCIVDILSRFIFEKSVLKTPIEVPLGAPEMCELMLKAQDASYGDGLDPEYKHPYMWLCKSHYYSAGLNYYNWPYAFGTLFGKGLYKEYLKDREKFVKNYDQMLRNTAIMPVEEVTKGMGIDVSKKEFWLESLKFIEEDIDLFEKLLKETKMIK